MQCVDDIKKDNKECSNKECRYWLDYHKDLNCTFVAISNNGSMKLEDVGSRLKLTAARIKQIQDLTLTKLSKRISTLKVFQE